MDEVTCLCSNARRAALALTALYDEALAPHGLKVTQFSLLHAIRRREGEARGAPPEPLRPGRRGPGGGPNLGALAEATGLDRSTLGRNLRVLEAAGVVALSAGDDQRDRVATLTRAGAARLRAATKAWLRLQDRLAGALGDDAGRLLAVTRHVTALARDPSRRAAALR